MQTAQSKAEAFVRENLGLFDRYHVSRGNNLRCKNCGEPNTFDNVGTCTKGEALKIGLHHWLRVLTPRMQPISMDSNGIVTVLKADIDGKTPIFDFQFTFNLTTGQPASEADYQSFCDIVGI